ncbi:MAG TPA: response regulator [Thermoanaerobaculia bacterium]|nr:response regulator [Thermoanaerobaculia bacterium]
MNSVGLESPGKLLLVDDDGAVQILIKAIFHRYDLTVDCAGDGDTALYRLRRSHYDAVLLDLMLPGANGFEIIRELKSRDRALLARTIVLTAAGDAMLRDFTDVRFLRRLMHKPFDLDELVVEVLSLTRAVFDHRIALQREERVH